MKKSVFILVAVLLYGTIVNSQNISDTLFNDYFLPDYIDIENCGSTIYRDSSTSTVALKRGHYYFGSTGWLYTTTTSEGILDRAQPCYTDTLLTVKGIAIGINSFFNFENYSKVQHIIFTYESLWLDEWIDLYNSTPKGKLKLMNENLNREIISVDIDTNFYVVNTPEYAYLEFDFDRNVNVNGLFYIVEDITNTSTRLLDIVFTQCNFNWLSLVRTAEDTIATSWMEWSHHPFNNLTDRPIGQNSYYMYYSDGGYSAIPNDCQMYMFPIFAETDTTLGDGTYPDTNVCLYDVNVDRYSNVYPNPASDIVTVQSSFKVKEIEIHNALGQVVLRKQGSQNIETIDVSNLQSGAYIVRIKTQRGFANKKLLIK